VSKFSELRAYADGLEERVEELTRERDSARNGVERNAEKASEYFKRAEQAESAENHWWEEVKATRSLLEQAEAKLTKMTVYANQVEHQRDEAEAKLERAAAALKAATKHHEGARDRCSCQACHVLRDIAAARKSE
jgi:chromosome segregation ATPase